METNDVYRFAEEVNVAELGPEDTWSVLIVDDDTSIHHVTNLALKDFQFDNKKLSLVSAHSFAEGKQILDSDNQKIALILLDVIMEESDSGLKLVKYLRENLNNGLTRIIIRTGHPGSAPENEIMSNYDINDYREKTELTSTRLSTVVNMALRTYRDMLRLMDDKLKLERMTNAANRFIPQNFLKLLNKENISDLQLADCIERNMNVLFLDIRSFTSLTEFLTPSETFQFVNDCMGRFEPNIKQNSGFVDKYIGDSIMALFATSSDEAVRAAIQIFQSLEKYNSERITQRQVPISIGIGINSGSVILGAIGFYDRIECTVISDAVNVASRIEKLNKLLGTQLLISESTYLNLDEPDKFNCRYLGKHHLYGKKQLLNLYEVFEINDNDVKELKLETSDLFKKAIALFEAGDYVPAKDIFGDIIKINKYDHVSKYFIERIHTILSLK